MSRRDASVHDATRWVFNRLAPDYLRRPGYPAALVRRLLELGGGAPRVADLGAGTGALAIPLARAGALVHAVEPARAMLDLLAANAPAQVVPVHAAAENTGLAAGAFDLAILADALQWVDPERAGRDIARLLAPGGVLAIVEPRLADTPFLTAVQERIAAANFKARRAPPPTDLVFSLACRGDASVERFEDEVLLSEDDLCAVLRSISCVGPALGPHALAELLADVRALARAHGGAVWRREIRLRWARR